MTQKNDVTTRLAQPQPLTIPLLIGAGIGLILISLFLSGVNDPDPGWGIYWMIKPLLIVPAAGACGGAVYYFLNQLRRRGKLNTALTIFLSLAVYLAGLFMGAVLGMDGTLWD